MEVIDNKNNEKIGVSDYIKNNSLLEVRYIPFDSKMAIVSHIINSVVDTVGGINTSLLRRISVEVFIESITNIDMKQKDEDNLEGFDQLCISGELQNLIFKLGDEYKELQRILDERLSDYIRIETNPSVTISKIYEQISDRLNSVLNYIGDYIQNIDVSNLNEQLGLILEGVDDNHES